MGRALLISLVLHALLLWQTPPSIPSGTLQPRQSTQANSLSVSMRTAVRQQTLAANSPLAPALKSIAVPQPVALPIPQQSLDSPNPPQPALTAALAESGEWGPDAEGLRQYRLSLAASARRFKLYPPLALEKGWRGTAEVGVAIAANGVSQPVQLLTSSGYATLDEAALEIISNAVLQTAVPASLRGRTFKLPLPVVFDLSGER